MHLEDYYEGDDALPKLAEAFLSVVGEAWAAWPHRQVLVERCHGDEAIAVAIFYLADEGALDWLEEKAPVLGGLSARQCMETPSGLKRLKVALMRQP